MLVRWFKEDENEDENHLALLQLSAGLIAFKKAPLATIATTRPAWLNVLADGTGFVVSRGERALAHTAQRLELADGLSGAMAGTRQPRSAHDPGAGSV
jgi:hypothetical protein